MGYILRRRSVRGVVGACSFKDRRIVTSRNRTSLRGQERTNKQRREGHDRRGEMNEQSPTRRDWGLGVNKRGDIAWCRSQPGWVTHSSTSFRFDCRAQGSCSTYARSRIALSMLLISGKLWARGDIVQGDERDGCTTSPQMRRSDRRCFD